MLLLEHFRGIFKWRNGSVLLRSQAGAHTSSHLSRDKEEVVWPWLLMAVNKAA